MKGREVATFAPPGSKDFAALLAEMPEKDRKSVTRHVSLYEEKNGPDAGRRWRRVAGTMMSLASMPARVLGQQGLQFFVPDGKYRKQVFALETLASGELKVYVENILAEAVRAGILGKPRGEGGATRYCVKGCDEELVIDILDGHTPDPAPIYTAMTGWNRRAIRITLSPKASGVEIEAVQNLCALAASRWKLAPASA
jgi:hypothetical protein